ncbi:SusC/RagA family TonB-linked outer membrane protein [Pedobacter boryungensis]|uniref:SusC/RagA family TonB-linked outer membrane protein n=1 Tax=Pedobacter boryungensis TaxID=869962 RepID=A0ABX2DEW5_9SPHI|nr:SusC/RagA family TonB-linked outer membrane protein [Pedobacter boryungensis]NQX32643.1 SusC/RagA family TonB-linked outer membrane protein [Pedobacter boryungensis]
MKLKLSKIVLFAWVFLITSLLSIPNAFSQNKITGTVRDKAGEIPGVTIFLKSNPKIAVNTDKDGKFQISAPTDEVLVFKMIGFKTKEVPASTSPMNIILVESESNLSEIIVTGYINIDRKKTTGALASISGKEIENLPAASVDVLLQGKLPGVNVQNFTGQPGVKTSLIVRGNTKISNPSTGFNADDLNSNPLYVMDGIPVSEDEVSNFDATGTNFLASLNPNDIESIDVLKDAASAALYGSRGANGVILIKTKRGKIGAPRFSVNSYYGYVTKPEKVSTLIGAAERRQKMDLIYLYGKGNQLKNNVPQMLTDSLNPAFNNHTDYQDLFYQPGAVQNYDVSASGGTEVINYRISTGLYNEKGVVINTGYKRYSFTSNIGINFSKKLELVTSLRASTSKRLDGKNSGSRTFRDVFSINPVDMPSSLLGMSDIDIESNVNPYEYVRNDRINTNISGSAELRYTFLNDFRISTRGSINYETNKIDFSSPSIINSDGLAYGLSNYNQNRKQIITNTLQWFKTLNSKHNITANVSQEYESRRNEGLFLEGNGIPNDNIKVVEAATTLYGSSDLSTYAKLSFIGAAHYDYNNKYLLDASWRADASSRFGKNNKWGYFPAVSAGWLLSEENFIKNLGWVNELKLRGSWGITGDESSISDNSRYNAYIAGNANYAGSTATSYGGVISVIPNYNGITNDDITWQQSESWNGGIDLSLFKYRLTASVDAYTRSTSGQMLNITIPEYTGYSSTFTNAASVRNSGIELSISGKVFSSDKAFQWNPSINIAFNKNMVTSLPNGNRDLYFGNAVYIVGKPLNMYYGYITDGVINSPGNLIVNPYTGTVGSTKWGTLKLGMPNWRDVNGDYYIGDNIGQDDRTFYGDPNPLATGGFTNLFTYKDFSLQIFTTFTFGRDIINSTLARRLSNGLFYSNTEDFANSSITDVSQYNYWRQAGDNATFPALSPFMGLYAYRAEQSIYKEKGWYVRVKNISMGYRFNPQKHQWLKKAGLSNLRIYSNIDNLHIFQKFSGIDAERVDGQGYDYGDGYPLPTKYTLGLQIEF